MAKGSDGKGGVKNFVKDMALGAAAAGTVDMFLEVSHTPFFNELSPIPIIDPQASNAESIIYGAGLVASTLGLIDVVGGKAIIPGMGRSLLAYGLGSIIGVQFYENELIKWLGIRDST